MDNSLDAFVEQVIDLIEPVISADFRSDVLDAFIYWAEIFSVVEPGELTPTITPADITTDRLRNCHGDDCKITLSLMGVNDTGQTVAAYAFTLDLENEEILDDISGDVWL